MQRANLPASIHNDDTISSDKVCAEAAGFRRNEHHAAAQIVVRVEFTLNVRSVLRTDAAVDYLKQPRPF